MALLQLVVQELARGLVTTVHLEALVEHGLVLGASSSHQLLTRELRGIVTTHRSLGSVRHLLGRSSTKTVGHGPDGAVGDRRTSPEGHALGDGRTNSGQHASALLRRRHGGDGRLLGAGRRGCTHGTFRWSRTTHAAHPSSTSATIALSKHQAQEINRVSREEPSKSNHRTTW